MAINIFILFPVPFNELLCQNILIYNRRVLVEQQGPNKVNTSVILHVLYCFISRLTL